MKPASRELTYAAAIREGFAVALERDPRVLLMGLGVPDPKGFFGTTTDLQKQFGADRVMDMPCAENGMSGVMLGAALNGLRPVLNHQLSISRCSRWTRSARRPPSGATCLVAR